MKSLDHTCRGIIFKSWDMKTIDILYNFEEYQSKLNQKKEQHNEKKKSMSKITERNMFLEKAGEVDLFYVIDPITEQRHNLAIVNKIATSIMLQKKFEGTPVNKRIEFICRYVPKFKKWEPINCWNS
jgi:hypothetical protein